uniref:Uncharacterized protein n=1 Tax=Arundo donax TaxID=35708 RepID=A0A0A9FG90_ARUDO
MSTVMQVECIKISSVTY